MKQRTYLLGSLLGVFLAGSTTVEAQHVDTFSGRLSGARSEGGALLPSARLLPRGSWEASWSYGHDGTVAKVDVPTGEVRGPGRSRSIDWLGSRDYGYLQVAAGVSPQVEVTAGLPLLLHQQVQGTNGVPAPRAGSAAVGDADLTLRYALIAPSEGRFAWSAQTGLLLPTGSDAFAFGDPGVRFRIATTFGVDVGAGFSIRAHAGYQTGETHVVGNQIFGDTLLAGLGPVWKRGPFQVHLEGVTRAVMSDRNAVTAKERVGVEGLLGGRYVHEAFFVDVAGAYGFVDEGLTPVYRAQLSAGVRGSLIKKEPVSQARVVEADHDQDGIPDERDACPTLAEDHDGYQDEDGCPETDNDGDGVLDAVDRCPNRAEDLDGIADEDGCPEEDADADGIPDAADRCPLASEDYDGYEDADGCPEPGSPDPRANWRAVALEAQVVHFQTGSNALDEIGQHVLRDVAFLLKQQEGSVVLVGHADERGSVELNEELSVKRAESVRERLIQAGIAAERLQVRGVGPSAPTAPGTDFGNSLNRRVTFVWAEAK